MTKGKKKLNWKPIFEVNEVEPHLSSISERLYNAQLNNDFSLLSGTTGTALFHYYYWKFLKKDKYLIKANSIISKNLLYFSNSLSQQYSLCNGSAGFLWAINHLIKNSFIDGDSENLFPGKDEIVKSQMIKDITAGKYDFLHNALGAGLYFSTKNDSQSKGFVKSLIYELEEIAEIDVTGLKWRSSIKLLDGTEEIYNTSMSHGITSIISFLVNVINKGIQIDRSKKLLYGAVNFLLSLKFETPEKKRMSYFPNYIFIKSMKEPNLGRLSWCYSDLSIGIALWRASQVLLSKEYENIAIKILLQTTLRTDPNKELINDAGFCHGSTGIAHIYNRMYQYTGIMEFKKSSILWLNDALSKAIFDNGNIIYKAHRLDKYGGPIEKEGLLEGIAGIGLVLLASIASEEPKWDECLLLS